MYVCMYVCILSSVSDCSHCHPSLAMKCVNCKYISVYKLYINHMYNINGAQTLGPTILCCIAQYQTVLSAPCSVTRLAPAFCRCLHCCVLLWPAGDPAGSHPRAQVQLNTTRKQLLCAACSLLTVRVAQCPSRVVSWLCTFPPGGHQTTSNWPRPLSTRPFPFIILSLFDAILSQSLTASLNIP